MKTINVALSRKIGIDARLWDETGVGRYIRNLVLEVQKIDKINEYILFSLSKNKESISSQISNPNFHIKIADIPWHSVTEQRKFPKILEKEKLHLMHFPYFSVPVQYKGEYLLTIHDLILHKFPTGKASTKSAFIYWLKHNAYKYIMKKATKNAAKIITVSQATKKEIMQQLHIPQDKIVVTYEGFDTKIISKNEKTQDLPEKYFLYVGNAYPHKNLERLIQACKALVLKDSNVRLILVGKEDYFYTRLEKKISALGLTKNILFMHSISDAQLAYLYQYALALVMPSLMEGFGLPVLEAMAQNCLVAVSDIAVFHEIAGDAALYFQPSDVQSMVNVLESILTGRIPDVTKRKEDAKEKSEKFSWQTMAEETLQIYTSCLSL